MTVRTLVVGNGGCAARVAAMLASRGLDVLLAGADERFDLFAAASHAGVECLASARMVACRGFAGNFEVLLETGRRSLRHHVAAIVVAEDARRLANFDRYGIYPSARVCSLCDFTQQIEDSRDDNLAGFEGKRVVFLDGLAGEGIAASFEEVLHNALAVQALAGAQTVVLTAHLKVAGDGLEALYCKAKEAGTLFFKFTDSLPSLRQTEDGAVAMTFTDKTTGHAYTLRPDVTVVDERWMPSEYGKHLGGVLKLHTDQRGFLQADNIHRTTVLTNRRGILACGLSRAPMSPAHFAVEAAEAVNAVFDLYRPGKKYAIDAPRPAARIDSGRCIKCLTCYRLCPHRAVEQDSCMIIHPDACESCGICAAECPRGAIGLGQQGDGDQSPEGASDTAGALVAFCCSRSAVPAGELAGRSRLALPPQLKIVEVPCGGALSERQILSALAGGARGVLVLTCHEGNCHCQTGNRHARRRVARLRAQLQPVGPMAGPIEIQSLAANMAAEFTDTLQRFDKQLQEKNRRRRFA